MLRAKLKRRSSGIVAAVVTLCDWIEGAPSVGAVRPSRCPACGAAARPVGGPLGLIGHGVREREVLGPVRVGEPPRSVIIDVRRYRCLTCNAVCTVGPPELLSGRRYSGAAILMALALWSQLPPPTGKVGKGLPGLPAHRVRALVSPQLVLGATAAAGWASLPRWARAGLWPLLGKLAAASWRELARLTVAALLRFSPLNPNLPLPERAFAAAAHAGRGPPH